jgi:hypothetical protein
MIMAVFIMIMAVYIIVMSLITFKNDGKGFIVSKERTVTETETGVIVSHVVKLQVNVFLFGIKVMVCGSTISLAERQFSNLDVGQWYDRKAA